VSSELKGMQKEHLEHLSHLETSEQRELELLQALKAANSEHDKVIAKLKEIHEHALREK
jgi:hypothetical protein